eukprot:3497661-Prymnesium_polylepis.1
MDQETIWERLCWLHHKRVRSSYLAGSWLEVYKEHHILRAGRDEIVLAREHARQQGAPVSRAGMSVCSERRA